MTLATDAAAASFAALTHKLDYLDEADIRQVVMSVPEVLGCHHIRTRGTADHTFLDLHVWFPGATPLFEAHRISHIVKDRLMRKYPQIADAVIHIEPPPGE